MDGLTVLLQCKANVTPNATNHIKLAIADTGDSAYDSNVLIKAGSLSTDLKAPSCRYISRSSTQVQLGIRDTGGLQQVTVSEQQNANVAVSPFTPGTTDEVVVTATKVNPAQSASFRVRATDSAGNVTPCSTSGKIKF
jgi:hypothetical protein